MAGGKHITHGHWHTPVYKVWAAMLRRCRAKSGKEHRNYSGRGITVCDRWLKFEAFLEDMGYPENGMTLERIDNNLGYSKDNCRWATQLDQSRNKRNNVNLTINGRTQCLVDWAREFGISSKTVNGRVFRGWTHLAAVTTPRRWPQNHAPTRKSDG